MMLDTLKSFSFLFLYPMENNIKLLIISHKRWGKDTCAEILRDNFGVGFISSSQACSDLFIFDILKDKYGYKTSLECFNDRGNHRPEWFKLIQGYNKDDKARLAKEILKLTNTYVGMRDRVEIEECKRLNLFDLIIWVDANKRLEKEPKSSFNISKNMADIIIDNNGTLDEFKERVINIGKFLVK
jgi:hypothetical protein